MKSASFPSLRVEPALRQAVESVLQEGETVSSFVERSVRALVRLRQDQEAFLSRGLAARERGRRDGAYIDADDVLEALASRLEKAKAHRS